MKAKNMRPERSERLSIAKVVAKAVKITDAVDAALLQKMEFAPTPRRPSYVKHAQRLAAKFR